MTGRQEPEVFILNFMFNGEFDLTHVASGLPGPPHSIAPKVARTLAERAERWSVPNRQ